MDSYSQLLERIAQSSKLPVEEIEQKIEAKRAKLSGLISKDGAAQIVAAELGVSFDNQKTTIAELSEGMKRARVAGKITRVFPIREFNKNGRSGKIGSFLLGDTTSNIRVVLWDMNHIQLFENQSMKEGDCVEILNASVRNSELHLSAFSDLKSSSERFDDVKTQRAFVEGTLKDAQPGEAARIRAVVVGLFEPKFFTAKDGSSRFLSTAVLDDGTETIRAILGPEQLAAFSFTPSEPLTPEAFQPHKQRILGEERFFSGTYKTNTYFNQLEFSISKIESVDPAQLLTLLENTQR